MPSLAPGAQRDRAPRREPRAAARGGAPAAGQTAPIDADAGPSPAVGRGGLLADPRLARGDRAQGIRLLRRLQRTHGNAAIARALGSRHRPTPLSIQAAVIDVPPPPTREAVEPPESDPRFDRATVKTAKTARRERKHLPAKAKAAEAQKAAVPPANDASSQAAAAQVGKMDAQKPGEFNKQAFIDAVEKAVTAATPGSLKEATEFKESGKAAQVKNQVSGMVTQDKQRAEKGIKDKTKEPPDTSVAIAKPVTPMPTEQPGGTPATVGAAAAMPEKRPATETDLRHGPASVENDMAENDVTEEQLRESNEPEFNDAVDAKKEAEVHSATAPAAYREEEAATLGQAKGAARGDEKSKLAGMHQGRVGALRKVTAGKAATKSKDEIRRLEVATKIDAIFARTKAEVTTILDGIEAKMTPVFDRGEKQARATFETYVSGQMRAYKKKRYSGIRGKGRWIRDKFRSLPSAVNKFYEDGKKIYLGLMTGVIGRVADVVGGELTKAKTRIAQGKAEVKTYVDALPKDLKKVGKAAQASIADQFSELESDVDSKQDELVSSLSEKYKEARGALDERIEALQEENKGLIDKAVDFVKGVINTIRKLKDLLFDVLARAASAIGKIIRAPIKFLGNLVGAVKDGVMLFKEHIVDHLAGGLTGWLFGQLAKTGIELPKSFDAKGILGLLLQILGLTKENIRARAVNLVGEKVVVRMEEGVGVFKTLATEGLGGLWEFVKDKVGDIKEAIIGPMIEFVRNKIIIAGVMWLVSLLNPASAFIKACKAIYNIVMFFVERAAQIKAFVDSVLDSIEAIASGGAGVAKVIENTLSKMVPLVVSFLAALLDVGGIGDKVRSVVDAVQKPVNKAIDGVLKGAIKLGKKMFGGAKALFSKGKAWVKSKAEAGKKWVKAKTKATKDWAKKKLGMDKNKKIDSRSSQQMEADLRLAVNEGTAIAKDQTRGKRAVSKALTSIRKKYGISSLSVVTDAHGKQGDQVHVRGSVNPTYDGDGFITSPFPPDAVVIEARIGPPRRRQRFEEVLEGPGQAGLPGYERAHLLGAGFGVESPLGVLYAPRYVNQILQNQGIEEAIRASYRNRFPGAELFIRAKATAHPGTELLAKVVYTLSGRLPGEPVTDICEFRIEVDNNTTNPQWKVRAGEVDPDAIGRYTTELTRLMAGLGED